MTRPWAVASEVARGDPLKANRVKLVSMNPVESAFSPLSPPPPAPVVGLMSARLDALNERQCIERVLDALAHGRGGWVVTPNLDHLRRAWRDPAFARLIDQADLRVADGMPLIWASRWLGAPLPERVAGSTLVWTLGEAAARRGRSVYLLGGAPGAARGAAHVLRQRFPELIIAGTHSPPYGFEHDEQQMEMLKTRLRAADPDIVYVALGSPKQERLIDRLRGELPGAWWLGVGISLSFLSGQVRRAPRWMQRAGLEWLHRLMQEPRRLSERYLVHDLPFAVLLLAWALRSRWRTAAGRTAGGKQRGRE